jgi:hypothetical protein
MDTIEDFIDRLSIGDIYWFKNPNISSPDPHPHIYVGKKDEDHLFMICCTSNFEGRQRYFEINELPFETLVRIKNGNHNKLTKDTYVDCNDILPYDVGDLYYEYKMQYWGAITDAELLQIKEGISLSELLEQEIIDIVSRQFPKGL